MTLRIQNKICSSYLKAQMLRVCSLAGETLATFSAHEVEGKTVHQLKSSLAKQIGATRFRQRWLAADHNELHDDASVACCDVQLVILDFATATKRERETLMFACKENRPEKVVNLLRKPFNPNGLFERQALLRALHSAAVNGHSQIVELLLDAGASPHAADVYGKTALYWAAGKGHLEVVKLLLEAGADKDETNPAGRTALHFAAKQGHSEVVRLLLAAGAAKDVADSKGKLPLDLAIDAGSQEIANLLQ